MSDSKMPDENESDVIEFVPDEPERPSSAIAVSTVSREAVQEEPARSASTDNGQPGVERSPAFIELAEPKLPKLERENRARLAMQTPNRLFFYWSTGENPFQTLSHAIRDQASNYSLVLKLTDLKRGTELIRPIEAEGSWWFDVEADGEYRAEIGFYSPSRPYIRILYSNTVQTPRKSPSRHTADEAEWRVSSDRFAKVLNVSGFKQDRSEERRV